MIEARQLRYLVAAIDAGTVAAAAEVVHISQPSLSRQIHALERRLGFAVFDRTGRRLALTAAGEEFLHETRDVLASLKGLEELAARLAVGVPGGLTVSAPIGLINQVLAPFYAEESDKFAFAVDFQSVLAADAVASLRGSADVTVAGVPPWTTHESLVVGAAPFVAQVPPGHHLAGRRSVDIRELVAEPLILMAAPNRSRVIIDDLMANLGLSYSAVTDSSIVNASQSLAAAGRGVAILTDLPDLGLVGVPIMNGTERIEITVTAMWEPGHYASEQIRHFAGLLQDYYGGLLSRYG